MPSVKRVNGMCLTSVVVWLMRSSLGSSRFSTNHRQVNSTSSEQPDDGNRNNGRDFTADGRAIYQDAGMARRDKPEYRRKDDDDVRICFPSEEDGKSSLALHLQSTETS
nr:hypothetical protein CFP56_69572 [Quercus suber]